MIQIIKASVNQVAVTLTELSTLVNPYYLFEFQNDQDNTFQYFIGTDLSLFPERFNLFNIEEKLLPNPLLGEVELELTGFYSYKIFEQLSSTNLNPALCDNLTPLELGKVLVIGTDEIKYTHDYNPDITVYNN